MDYFTKCFDRVIGHEGNYVNHPKDPGGETKFGITKRTYPHLNIKSLTVEDARDIYRRDFWNKCRCNELPVGLAFLVFDASINHGAKQSVKFLQRAVGSTDDGLIGPKTIAAAGKVNSLSAIDEFCAQRALFYTDLSTFKTFGKGWIRRAFATHREALADIQ